MNTLETVIWSVMLGGLLTIGTMALVDVVLNGSKAAWRGLFFMAINGSSCVLLSGLPEDVFNGLPLVPVLVLKASLGPLSGAMVLTYLNQWLGVAAEDRMVHNTIVWGSVGLVFAAVLLTVLSSLFASQQSSEILLLAACVNALSVLLATLTSVRAAHLGDKMARSMVVGCLFLAVSVAGLYSHQLTGDNFDLPVIALTSFSTVVFFLVMVSLGIRHNQAVRRLERLAGLSQGMDPATGLPRGSLLLSKVDDAFWRSARLNASCTVICLHLRNLYELSEDAGHGVEQQILSSMAARIRRAVGFRCVVGLYHPRCFVVVLSALKHAKSGTSMAERLRALISKPMEVLGQNETLHVFSPHLSVGSVTVSAASAIPGHVIDEAEQMALASEREKPGTRGAHSAWAPST